MKPFVSGSHKCIDDDLPLNHSYTTFFHGERFSIVSKPTEFVLTFMKGREGESTAWFHFKKDDSILNFGFE